MINNEKWHGKSNNNASRDGKPYEKRDVRSILKGSKGAPRYNNERSEQDSDNERPVFRKRDDNASSSSYRGNYENRSNSYGERRPSSGQNQNQGGRPRFVVRKNNDGSPSEGGNNRRYNSYDNNQGGDRPIKRPRINFRPNDNQGGGYQRNRNSEGYIETRFDNRQGGTTFRKPRKNGGNYDPNSKYSQRKQIEYRSVQIDPTKPVRLNKFLANAGICSRREADEFIQAGVITVNGEVVSQLGAKILPTDKVMFHNQLVRSERKVYILLNKPKDCVTTSEDTHDRLTVLDLVKNACSERIYPVGRLDRNTTGVILLTNDGDLASKLTHPKYEKKKIYHVVLDRVIETADFEAILSGIQLEDEKIAADSLEFVKEGDFKQLGIEIHSGQNRVVRRIFEKLGYKVVRLDRVYFAGLTKKNLPRGKYRYLSEREVNMLRMGAYE